MVARISTDSVNCQCCYFQLSDSAFLEVSGLPGNAVRVRMQPEFPFREKEEFIFGKYQALQPDVEETPENFIIRFPGISVRLDKAAEALSFFNETGERLLGEIPGSRFFQKKNNFRSAGIAFDSPPDEALFGLGEFQDGALNIRNLPRRLIQVNTQASLPMLYSTRGYGLLWHNYSMTEFNPGEIAIPLTKTGEGQSQEIEVTTSEGGSKDSSSLALWTGEFRTEESGEFAFALDCGQVMTRTHVLRIDGQTVFQRRNFWLPPFMGGRIRLEAGLHRVEVENESRDIPVLTYRADRNRTVFRSDLFLCRGRNAFLRCNGLWPGFFLLFGGKTFLFLFGFQRRLIFRSSSGHFVRRLPVGITGFDLSGPLFPGRRRRHIASAFKNTAGREQKRQQGSRSRSKNTFVHPHNSVMVLTQRHFVRLKASLPT